MEAAASNGNTVWAGAAPTSLSSGLRQSRTQKFVIECEILRKGLERTIGEGIEQTTAYMDRCAAAEGHLVVFDRSEDRPWREKIFRREGVRWGCGDLGVGDVRRAAEPVDGSMRESRDVVIASWDT